MLDKEIVKSLEKIIFKYINPKDYEVFVFGSRVNGNPREFSDIDIGIEGKIPLNSAKKYNIINDLEESDIPYLGDIVDFTKVDTGFYHLAKVNILYITPSHE